MRILLTRVLTAAALVLAGPRLEAQISTDIIRGRVTDQDAKALEGVEVKATSYQGNVSKTATTDRGGRFTIAFINGEGDYWITMRKLGFAQKRFEIKKLGDEEVMIADARLLSAIATIDGMTVTAQKDRALPNRNGKDADVGGGERPLTNANVAPDEAGSLAAMAAAAGFQIVPGLDGAPDMYSVLGLTNDQNNVTFNGLGSGISALPPDVLATTSINPYPFDVSKGGFSGAQITIQTLPGSNFSRRAITSANIAPALEWADRTAAEQGLKYTNVRFGGNAAGPISTDRAFYNTAYSVARRTSDSQTLLNTGPAGLAAAGVAMDSVNRLLGYLDERGIAATLAGVPGAETQDLLQGLLNFDMMPSASGTGHSFTLGAAGNYQRTGPVDRGGSLLATPGHADQTTFWGVNGALTHMNYFGFGVLSKTTFGVAARSTSTLPFEDVPEGIVRVTSALPDGGSSVRALSFGGNAIRSSSRSQGFQLNNQLTWFSLDNAHTIRVTSSVAEDAFETDLGQRLAGTFAFNSLADLAANTAASFTRTLSSSTQSGRQLVGNASIGDYWRPTPEIQVQYGVRADANRFVTRPALNADVANALGVNNGVVPNGIYFSPRAGMQWAIGKASEIQYAPGSARPPRAMVHAGAGVFQNMAPATLLAPAMSTTGLPSSTQSITCVGSAVPFPQWRAFVDDASSVPSSCADGSSGSAYATTSPAVRMFDPHFRQPRSVRAAADWSGPILDNRVVLGVQGVVSWGLHQQGTVDANLVRRAAFTLANEGGRPVYAPADAIVPSTGTIAAGGGRVSSAFQSVLVDESSLRNRARELSIDVKPVTARAKLRWDLTYTLLDVREQFFGFASTTGDPFATQWGRSLVAPRHTINARWVDYPVFDVVYLTAAISASSGLPYTPMIASDVNGDGVANDRAFVADPETTSDQALAAAMKSLVGSGSSSARSCLARQLGRLASRGSCQAPWTIDNALLVRFNPRKIGLPKRASVFLTLMNPIGVADLALHGTGGLRGWGQRIPPDQNLLFVRGFDPATRRFSYDVNQRFGSTSPRESATRAIPYLSLSVTLDVGVPRERQLLTQRLDAGRRHEGTRADAAAMRNFGLAAIPNPMAMILTQQRELRMTQAQADSLATLSHSFSTFADSVWMPVATYFAALPESYRTGDAYGRYVSARERTVDYLLALVPDVEGVLTPSQRRQLPLQIANYLDRRVLQFIRSSTLGTGS
jgi:hypothetical protein